MEREFKILRNERKEANDFSMECHCDFCNRFSSSVIEIPDPVRSNTSIIGRKPRICSTCLHEMQEALAKNIRDNFQKDFDKSRQNSEEANPIPYGIGAYFTELRFNDNHHLGLGDIKLTLAQQEEIINHCKKLGDTEK